jgi:hypothetical protein
MKIDDLPLKDADFHSYVSLPKYTIYSIQWLAGSGSELWLCIVYSLFCMGSPAELRFEFPNHMEAIAVSTNIVFYGCYYCFWFLFFLLIISLLWLILIIAMFDVWWNLWKPWLRLRSHQT